MSKTFPRIRAIAFLALAVTSALLLSSCAGAPKPSGPELTPMPEAFNDPDDAMVVQAVRELLKDMKAPAFSQFEFSRHDLDNDGRRDALVLLKNPYGYWCGTNGCTVLVLKAHNNGFTLVNAVQPVRPPLYVSDTETQGWKDLIVRISGRMHQETRNVALHYDGRQYDDNPTVLPATSEAEKIPSTTIFP